ncbi:MAG TPA: MarR family transcriptional regulator [Candidatus Limnocylindria bacterium]|nr:MarR family transcriptional regulator [Candidatus Limnocylindria bacterium]
MRSITDAKGTPPVSSSESADVETILTEVNGWVGELRCASMGRLVQGRVSLSQMHVLWLLQHHGEMSMSRLAELLDISLSNATGLIDRMAEHGLIERSGVPDDRRVVLVRPAAGGLRALSETETSRRERMRAVLGHLPQADRPIVLAALRSLRRALSAEDESAVHEHHFADQAN